MTLSLINGDGDIVKALRKLLAQAERGDLDGLAYATLVKDEDDPGVVGLVWLATTQFPLARGVAAAHKLANAIEELEDG